MGEIQKEYDLVGRDFKQLHVIQFECQNNTKIEAAINYKILHKREYSYSY